MAARGSNTWPCAFAGQRLCGAGRVGSSQPHACRYPTPSTLNPQPPLAHPLANLPTQTKERPLMPTPWAPTLMPALVICRSISLATRHSLSSCVLASRAVPSCRCCASPAGVGRCGVGWGGVGWGGGGGWGRATRGLHAVPLRLWRPARARTALQSPGPTVHHSHATHQQKKRKEERKCAGDKEQHGKPSRRGAHERGCVCGRAHTWVGAGWAKEGGELKQQQIMKQNTTARSTHPP